MRKSLVLRRTAARVGVALWRHRMRVLGGAVIVGAFDVYQLSYAVPISSTSGDGADTTMAAVTQVDDAVAHAAYACLGPGMRTTSEDQLSPTCTSTRLRPAASTASAMRAPPMAGASSSSPVDGPGSAFSYIVYLSTHAARSSKSSNGLAGQEDHRGRVRDKRLPTIAAIQRLDLQTGAFEQMLGFEAVRPAVRPLHEALGNHRAAVVDHLVRRTNDPHLPGEISADHGLDPRQRVAARRQVLHQIVAH
jgi:hypothetical protein